MAYRYFLHLAYNGSGFHGWQIQDNVPTIQQLVNDGLQKLTGNEANVVGCGRTDTGVNANNFYAHFDAEEELNVQDRMDLCFRLNRLLPKEIVIFNVLPVRDSAHARFDATSRTYNYFISRRKDPFFDAFSNYIFGDLDMEVMNVAADKLLKINDFTSFSKLHTQVKTNNCKLQEAHWREEGHLLIFTITADRFLRNMVRAIVGTLIDIGQEKTDLDEFVSIIESKNRSDAGYSVPAQGLFLEKITYPEGTFI